MVSNKFLGALCVKLGFHRHIRLNTSATESRIRAFVQDIQEAEEEAGGAPDYWVHGKDPPKVSMLFDLVHWSCFSLNIGIARCRRSLCRCYLCRLGVQLW